MTLPEEPEEPGRPKRLTGKAAAKSLDRIRKAWSNEEMRKELLEALAIAESEPVDLRDWARTWFVKAYPFKTAELKELLAAKRYDLVLDHFLLREPSAALYKLAAKDDALVSYCNKKQKDAFVFARKGIMGLTYWMTDEPPPEDFDWEGFSHDISVSGLVTADDRKRVVGIMIGGETVMQDVMPRWIDRQLGRAFLMDAIAAGKPLKAKKLEKKIDGEKARILKALRRKYG